jgi:hypothetical protein
LTRRPARPTVYTGSAHGAYRLGRTGREHGTAKFEGAVVLGFGETAAFAAFCLGPGASLAQISHVDVSAFTPHALPARCCE